MPFTGELPSDIARHRVLNTKEAATFCGFSVPHWRRLYRAGQVPQPIQLGVRKLGFRTGDLIDWISSKSHPSA